MSAAAAGFFLQLDRADHHAAVDAFAHVVDGECGDVQAIGGSDENMIR